MKVLFVASYNKGFFSPFIVEQAEALRRIGCDVQYYGVVGHGIVGYSRLLSDLKRKIKSFRPDIIHAHYGLCGLLACMQRSVPVVVTYHGSDINSPAILRYSKLAMRLAAWNIFVSEANIKRARQTRKLSLIPCGIDLTNDQLLTREEARQMLNISNDSKVVLFTGAFDNQVKNYPLAKQTIDCLPNVELIELKGYTRQQVTLLMCAVDALLMTSFAEGSPQVIKEALACGCPIVSVDVGDVKERIQGVQGCYIAHSATPEELSHLLTQAFLLRNKTKGRDKIQSDGLSNDIIAEKLLKIYKNILI